MFVMCVVSSGPSVGSVRLELTFNPDTSMVGVRLHEHTLSATKTGDVAIYSNHRLCIILYRT